MIRNLMLGMSLVTLSTVSAFAAAPAATHHAKASVVAQAPAAEGSTPSTDKPVKKSTKKASAPKKVKGETKGDTKKESKGESAPAGEKAPAPATK
jgi:hypothetical protein